MILTPGSVSLDGWKAIYRGAAPRLDPASMDAVAASAAAVARIVERGDPVYGINTGFGKLAHVRIEQADLATLQRNIVLSHAAGVGDPMPIPIARLMMALKLASLARGASGVQPATVQLLEAMLARGLTPLVPAQGSVGASGDLAPLAHMTAAMIGVGTIYLDGVPRDAAEALAAAGLAPLELGAKEGLALLNGTQFSCAYALAALIEAERLYRSALVTGILSTEAAKGTDAPFDARVHLLRGHAGQIETAAALRDLMADSAIRASHRVDDARVQDPYCLRCQPQVMGAVLDLLRQAAITLLTEANGVSDNPLIFADTDEALSGGNFDPALSGLPAFLTPRPGLNSGFMIPQVTAAALVSENKQRATPASVDSIPTSANQEDHVSMAAHGSRRLMAMAANVDSVLGIELLAGAQGCDFLLPLRSSAPIEAVRALLRERVPMLIEDRHMAPDMALATTLVAHGTLLASVPPLPGVA